MSAVKTAVMTTIITAHAAHDFLALVPSLAGFVPRDSLVLVAFRGNRTCGALRIDLPGEDAPAPVRKAFATTTLGMVCKIPDIDAIVPVVYTDDTFERFAGPPRRALIANLTTRARHGGFLVRDALCVASDAWGSYLDDGPRRGRSLALIARSVAQHEARLPRDAPALGGVPALGDVVAAATLDAADADEREQVSSLYGVLSALRASAELLPVLYWEYNFDGDIVAFADHLVTARPASHTDADAERGKNAALLAFLVQSPAVRDTVLMTWGWGTTAGDESTLTQRMFASGEDISGIPGAGALGGWDMPRPDPDRIRSAIAVLRFAAARIPSDAAPALLTMIGWLYWALGAGSVAARWTAQAVAIDPGYGLADLLGTMIDAGHLPEWAFDVPPDATLGEAIEP